MRTIVAIVDRVCRRIIYCSKFTGLIIHSTVCMYMYMYTYIDGIMTEIRLIYIFRVKNKIRDQVPSWVELGSGLGLGTRLGCSTSMHHTCMCTHAHDHSAHTHTCSRRHTYTCMHMPTCPHAHAHTYSHMYTYVYIHSPLNSEGRRRSSRSRIRSRRIRIGGRRKWERRERERWASGIMWLPPTSPPTWLIPSWGTSLRRTSST